MRKARPGNPEDRWHRASEIHDAKRQQFQVWAAAVRACVEETQALARQSMEKGQALEHLLQSPDPDPDAIGTMISISGRVASRSKESLPHCQRWTTLGRRGERR